MMRPNFLPALFAFAIGAFSALSAAPAAAQVTVPNVAPPGPAVAAQGRYLIENVGLCLRCHGAQLQGTPANPNNPNAVAAPALAGLPMFPTDADAVKFFTTGLMPDGSKARPPMAPFRFKENDAQALVAYLRSLK